MDFYGDPLTLQEILQRFACGEDSHSYRWLGCHPLPDQGVVFRLWAPEATAVSLVGDHNGWDPMAQPMERLECGVWECACQDVPAYTPYKYHIIQKDGQAVEITDPYAVATEGAPGNASLVGGVGVYPRQEDIPVPADGALNIYRVHVGSWRRYTDGRPYDFAMLAEQLVPYVAEMGYTHLLLDGVVGDSPFAPNHRLGQPHDLMALIEACHLANVGVLLTWCPPCVSNPEDAAVGSFWKSNALYWLEEYHVDGLLVSAEHLAAKGTSFWIAWTDALRRAAPTAQLILEGQAAPTATLSTAEGGWGFSRMLDSAWSADTACFTALPGSQRGEFRRLLTDSLHRGFARRYVLPLMPVDGAYPVEQMPGSYSEKLAAMRALLGYQMAHPGGKLQYMGTEFGQFKAWDPDGVPDWLLLDYEEHRMMRHYCRTLNQLYRETPVLWEQEDSGLCRVAQEEETDGIFVFHCAAKADKPLVAVCNFRSTALADHGIGLPVGGRWVEVFNSDLAEFGGQGRMHGTITAMDTSLHGQPCCGHVSLPPLSVLFLQPAED